MSYQQPNSAPPMRKSNIPRWIRFCHWLWPKLLWVWGTLIVGSVIGIIANLSTTTIGKAGETGTSLTDVFSKLFIIQLVRDFPFLVLFSLSLLVLFTLFSRIGSQRFVSISSVANRTQMSALERTHIAHCLRHRYREILTQSLEGFVHMELGLASRPSAIHNAVSLSWRLPTQADHLLPSGTSIVEAYEQAQQELLILGEPGAGKSTLLIELALHLIAQSERDEKQPLPVWFPLSSWATNHPPLQDWLVEQFARLYKISPEWSRHWIEAGMILPLLDGLDEMEESMRPACIAAINTYHREHPCPLVVCSRTAEYEAAASHERLLLENAVVIQPLTKAQVNTYLVSLGKPLAALRTALKKNTALAELATTPLILHILLLTYYGMKVRQLSQKTSELQQQIWTAYVKRMVARKGNQQHYPLENTCSWLHWLAQQMREHNLTIFYLEQVQLDWLPKGARLAYRWSLVLLFGLSIVLFQQLAWLFSYWLPTSLFRGIVLNPLGGLVGSLPQGLFLGFIGSVYFARQPIRPLEALLWSWASIWSRALVGISVGVSGGSLFFFSKRLRRLVTNVSEEQIKERIFLSPNEGIRRSAKNGILVGLMLMPFAGLFSGLLAVLDAVPQFGIGTGLALGEFQIFYSGLLYGFILGLFFGIGAFLQHYILRFWFWRTHTFPLKAVSFLEDATTRILLQRVGGEYSFTHRLLLEYFAHLDISNQAGK